MNQLTPYEKLIAGKTAALPVPDMADEIWARIEAQLDAGPGAEGPDDSGNGGNPPAPRPPKKTVFTRAKFLVPAAGVVIIALVVLLRPGRQRTRHEAPPPVQQQPVTAITADSQPANTAPMPTGPPPLQQAAVATADTGNDNKTILNNDTVPLPNSGNRERIPAFETQPDAVPPPAAENRPDTSGKGKKPKGVTGINGSDYKIVPRQKDSVKKY